LRLFHALSLTLVLIAIIGLLATFNDEKANKDYLTGLVKDKGATLTIIPK